MADTAINKKPRIRIQFNARGSHSGLFEIMLPYGGITRIRFIGYDLNRQFAAGTPA
jgi:hypothetical protein